MAEIIDCLDNATMNPSKIMVIGVGGGGSNAVKYMHSLGIHDVEFMVCNTDAQALAKSPIAKKMQLGKDLTKGLGAGNKPERGRAAAVESTEDIRAELSESEVNMVFITAGMGGGTGTGAAPVIAQVARELGVLVVAIVTLPFRAEGKVRVIQATKGIEEIRKYVDSLLVIDNENIVKMYGKFSFSSAFGRADDILATAAKGIAEIITKEITINVDFADVRTIMSNSGISLMGFATAELDESESKAIELTEAALRSPLLNQSDILGAKNILLKISWKSTEPILEQVKAIIDHVQAASGSDANIIWGIGEDESLADNSVSITIIATGFESGCDIPDDIREIVKANHIAGAEAPKTIPVRESQPQQTATLDTPIASGAVSSTIASKRPDAELEELLDEEQQREKRRQREVALAERIRRFREQSGVTSGSITEAAPVQIEEPVVKPVEKSSVVRIPFDVEDNSKKKFDEDDDTFKVVNKSVSAQPAASSAPQTLNFDAVGDVEAPVRSAQPAKVIIPFDDPKQDVRGNAPVDNMGLEVKVRNEAIVAPASSPVSTPVASAARKEVEEKLSTRGGVLFDDTEFQTPKKSAAPVAAASKGLPAGSQLDLSIDELEEAPAYIRRRMLADVKPTTGKKVSKLNIKDDF